MIEAKALWIVGEGRAELRRESVAAPGPGEVRVRARFSGVSRGTESLVLAGRVPDNQVDRMRAPFQAGTFPWPVKYGYASVGVIETGTDAGGAVFCLHPHQDVYVVPAAATTPLPPALPPERAVLMANLETAINACWDAQPAAGQRISVVGAGVVGALTAWCIARTAGVEVQLLDVAPERSALATALGLAFRPPDQAETDRHLVVEASGAPEGLRTALRLAGDDGTVLCLSWFGDQPVTLALGEDFHSRRLTIRASQVGALPPHKRQEWTLAKRLAHAADVLAGAPELDVLVDGEGAFEDLPQDLVRVAAPGARVLCHRVRYGE